MIAGWVDYGKPEGDHLMPELWQYFLPPEEKIQCFNIRSTIWSMDLNLHSFAAVGNRMIFLGFEGNSEGDTVPDNATYNVCVEVNMGVVSKNGVPYFPDVCDGYGSFVIYISRQKLRLRKSE